MNLIRACVFPAVAALGFALVGCSDDASQASGGGDARLAAGVELSGQVVKGITANAVVTAYAPDGSGGFTLLSSTTSDALGAYKLTLPTGYQGPVKVVATASAPPATPTLMRCDAVSGCGSFADVSEYDVNGNTLVDFGEWFPVAADFSLRGVAVVDGTGIRFVNLTPLSSLASDWAEKFPQGLDDRSVLAANTQVAVTFGYSLSDLEGPLGDITSKQWLLLADPQQVKLSLLMATFAELAAQVTMTQQGVVDLVSYYYSDQQGRLLQDGGDPSVGGFLSIMHFMTIAGVIDMPPATQDAINAAIDDSLAQLQSGEMTGASAVTLNGLLTRLGPLGEDINELLGLTGLDDPAAFIMAQAPYYEWLLTNDNLNLVSVGVETVMWAISGSMKIDMPATPDSEALVDDGLLTVTLDKVGKSLHIDGLHNGQTVDLTVSLTGLKSGLQAGQLDYGIVGTIANDTATGSIDGTLSVDTTGSDMSGMVAALDLLTDDDTTNDVTGLAAFKIAFYGLAQSATVSVALNGTAQLVRNSDPTQVLGGAVSLTGSIDLGATVGETIATLDVASADLVLPGGDHFYGLADGTPVLTVRVGDDATLVLDGAATVLGLPEATAHADGTLVNARALFEHVRDTLITQFGAGTTDLNSLLTALFDFDASQLALHGVGVIEIPALGHEYRGSLDNLTATVYQPHSEEVAMTATLDIEQQAVHFMLGTEPWDMRILTTPTPRVVMLGPDGQFMEASQEDFYTFMSSLPLGDLLGGGSGSTVFNLNPAPSNCYGATTFC